MSETPPEWVTAKPAWAPVHEISETPGKIPRPDFKQFDIWRGRLVEMVLQQVVAAVKGILMPGKAFPQLQQWGDQLQSAASNAWAGLNSLKENLLNAPETVLGLLGIDLVDGLDDELADIGDAAADAWDKATDLAHDLLTNPGDVLGMLPPIKVGGISGLPDIGSALQDLVDKGVQALGNTSGSGFSFDDLFGVQQQQQRQLADINAGLAAIKADQQGQINSGKSVTVSLAGVADGTDPASLGFTKIVDIGSQNVVISGEALDMGSGAASTEGFLYTLDKLATDYFEVSWVMPRRAGSSRNIFGQVLSGNSGTTGIGRSNVSGSRRCVARVWYDKIRVGCVVDGNTTWFAPAGGGSVDASVAAPAGAYVTFRGGTTGGVRIFQVLINNQIKVTRTDTGNISYAGDDYRHCGYLLESDGEYRPNNISIWTMNDNAPAATGGAGYLEVYRASPASTAQNNASFAAFSAHTLDTEERRTADIGWDPVTQTATVSLMGPYMVTMRERTALDQNSSEEYHNGVLHTSGGTTREKHGHGWDAPSVSGGNNSSASINNQNRIIGGMPIVLYCQPGDTIRPAHKLAARQTTFPVNGEPQGVVGDAAGASTWMTIVKLG